MVSFVLRKTKRTGEFSRDLCGRHAWNEKRNRPGVFFEKWTVTNVEFPLFATHDGKIEDRKVNQKNQSRDPGARGNSGAQSQDGASEIQRIAGVRVRTGHGEDLLFAKIARCVRAQP